MQTVQVFGGSMLQFLGEVVDGPVVATTGAGMVLPVVVQDRGSRPSCSRTRLLTCPFCWSRPCSCSSWTNFVDMPVGVQRQEIELKLWRFRSRSSVCLSGSWTRLFTCLFLRSDTCPWWSRQCSSRTRMLTCPCYAR